MNYYADQEYPVSGITYSSPLTEDLHISSANICRCMIIWNNDVKLQIYVMESRWQRWLLVVLNTP